MIKSYLPLENLSISDLNNFILFFNPNLLALILVIFNACLLISTPTARKFFFSFKIVREIHPEPIPISKKLSLFLSLNVFKTCSTIISVSGLGIKTLSFNSNSNFQKNFLPVRYAIGLPFDRSQINFLKLQ